MEDVEYTYNEAITIAEKRHYGENYKKFIINLDKNIKKQVMEKLPKKYAYMYRGILFNLVKKFKNKMIINININKISYLDNKIDVDVKIFSLCGTYNKNYIINLELSY